MKTVHKAIIGSAVVLAVIGLIAYLFLTNDLVILEPKGIIADQQKKLIVFATVLSMLVIVPVFIMTAVIAVKYREGNKKSKYRPEFDHNRLAETLWWGIPICIIFLLSVVTWKTSHSLDPFKPLASSKKPLTIQVVALQWKWLFIYPEQHIATLNYIQIPVDTPINFEITSDAPMNSFWVPQLGGQIYAMSGMSTQLHIMADEAGSYNGSSANISGKGFADMNFKVNATSQSEYDQWVSSSTTAPQQLDANTYSQLAKPSTFKGTASYTVADQQMYHTIIDKYMGHDHNSMTGSSVRDSMYMSNEAMN